MGGSTMRSVVAEGGEGTGKATATRVQLACFVGEPGSSGWSWFAKTTQAQGSVYRIRDSARRWLFQARFSVPTSILAHGALHSQPSSSPQCNTRPSLSARPLSCCRLSSPSPQRCGEAGAAIKPTATPRRPRAPSRPRPRPTRALQLHHRAPLLIPPQASAALDLDLAPLAPLAPLPGRSRKHDPSSYRRYRRHVQYMMCI